MLNSPFFKPLSVWFSVIGLIQAIAWSVMSLLAILFYFEVISIDFVAHLPIGLQGYTTAFLLLYFRTIPDVNTSLHYLTPEKIHVLMWFYLMLSIFWICSCSSQLCFVSQKRKENVLRISTIVMVTLTYAICLLDFVFLILVAADYNQLIYSKDSTVLISERQYPLLAACGTLLTLAARGFTLWLINFILSIMLTVVVHRSTQDRNLQRTHSPTPHFNKGYDDDEESNSYTEEPPQQMSWLAKLNAERYGIANQDFSAPVSKSDGPRRKPTFQESAPPAQHYALPKHDNNHQYGGQGGYGQSDQSGADDRSFGAYGVSPQPPPGPSHSGYGGRPVLPTKPALRRNQYGPVIH